MTLLLSFVAMLCVEAVTDVAVLPCETWIFFEEQTQAGTIFTELQHVTNV